jgi:DHA1 family bicyclomycin/chloramphenicol resistance-like MFS transporter
MFPPADAQRVMSQVTIYFGIAPAVAPLVGGWLFVGAGWHSIFWLLVLLSAALWLAVWRTLPETLHAQQRQPVQFMPLLRGYLQMSSNPRFLMLALASGIPFNGMFLYVLSAPTWLGEILKLQPTQFFWFFCMSVSGIMLGAWLSGRLAGRIKPKYQIRRGFIIMLATSVANVILNLLFEPQPFWALLTVSVFSFGWALMVPVVTLLVLDLVPDRRGMASSVQAFIGSMANGLVAGIIAPLVMHSAVALAFTSLGMLGIGVVAWIGVKPHVT